MSRSNKNNRKKIKFFKSENETHCSSSSSSSNSDDGDVIKNIPNKASFANKNHGTFMGGSEAPSEEVFFEYLVPKDENLSDMLKSYINTENNDASHTDMKIGRIRSLSSNEIKILLIVDVLENKLLKDDVNYDNYRIGRIDVESSKQEERPNDMNIKRKIKSRRIFKLSEELTKKFDEKELKVFERHSFTKPDDVMKLLLSDDNLKSVASKFDDVDKKSTIFKRDFETNQFEPINKKIKCTKESTFCDTKSYTFPYYGLDPSNNVRFRTNVNHRTRLLHKFLKECYAPKMQQTNKFTDRRCNSTITKNENRDATLQERWKLLRDFAVLQENVENVNVLVSISDKYSIYLDNKILLNFK